jgi:PAS domain S-box-containing protein
VLQMSASAIDDGSRVSSLEAGADGYVTSPLEPAVLVATVRSLLRIRTAEKALNEASLQWQATFDAISDGVALLDECGRIKRSNAAMAALLGERKIDTLEMDAAFPAERGEPAIASLLESRQRSRMERTLGDRCFRISIDPMTDAAGKLLGGVAIVTDITERKRLDEQLRHAQKLESIGLLAGGVAHDFNNILMGVLGNASLALESLDEPKKTGELLRDVVHAGERAAELTRQLLAYAGKGRFIVGPVDLSRLIHDLVPLIQPSIPRNVRLALELEPDLPAVQADKTQLEQLVMNLIINAGEAMEEGRGTLSVSTSHRHVSLEDLGGYLTEHQQPGEYVVMEVSDTGSGMDEETVKRIFDPFFSTKFLGRGLGLSAALGIVRGHKGGVKVTTAPGCGTTFEVLFPAIAMPVAVEPPRDEPNLVEGRGTILAVDDEEIVRSFLQHALVRAGYEVLMAEDGEQALEMFAEHAGIISLVMLDLVMPVMSGEEVLPQLLAQKPGLKVVVTSGQDEEECMRKLREPRVAGFLRKPYTIAALTSKVQSVMGEMLVAGAGSASERGN